MPVSVDEIIAALPKERQGAIKARAAMLIAEEITKRDLRKARKSSQARLARALGVERDQLPALEKQTDVHLAALRRAIEALGGKLTLSAEFSGGAPLNFSSLGEIAEWEPDKEEGRAMRKRKPRSRSKAPRAARVPTSTAIALQS